MSVSGRVRPRNEFSPSPRPSAQLRTGAGPIATGKSRRASRQLRVFGKLLARRMGPASAGTTAIVSSLLLEDAVRRIARGALLRCGFFQPCDLALEQRNALGQFLH